MKIKWNSSIFLRVFGVCEICALFRAAAAIYMNIARSRANFVCRYRVTHSGFTLSRENVAVLEERSRISLHSDTRLARGCNDDNDGDEVIIKDFLSFLLLHFSLLYLLPFVILHCSFCSFLEKGKGKKD